MQLCERSCTPQQKVSSKDKHYTILGLTVLTSEHVICVVIFAGKRNNALWELGLDLEIEVEGDARDDDFVQNNSGKGKRCPMGPTCKYTGKDVIYVCCWSPKGGVTSIILTDILATLDHMDMFDRTGGVSPFLLIDGHHSRFKLPFLRYICNPLHLWAVFISVPYDTALWQVGDAPEQNGSLNMVSVVKNREIVKDKE